mmetsp:Transcript_20140/g.48102  ORF Transcript_20140/g.48102 Transcript_20140/m.48102 type:complete len:462 (+) Transcript_20140:43-1428(+)|eukprot:CAMPEP_0168743760 /NCGR_PEP_ID=MMETSP0724-20121128/13744_1 /TAXON_ID=265536 /ORGANISM="Amphiprora sp., Strain CCMP467" /LENGTH=461 /DNA_ID=CAMNT_0008791403 /DNA_START=30 /DNA_END=1415 /DNA_ORIENTATION=+
MANARSTGEASSRSAARALRDDEALPPTYNSVNHATSFESKAPPSIPRLVRRNLTFNQSKNVVRVSHNKGIQIFELLRHDWFHVFLRQNTFLSTVFLISVWTTMILVFAGLYVAFDNRDAEKNCGLGQAGDPIHFGAAFAFSLETSTTVGYGLPNSGNAYFEAGCGGLQTLIYFQMVWSMMFNAFLFAFFYNRLGRCEARGAQVVLSNKAIVHSERGQIRFQIRIFDVDARYPVVEAHVRLYAVSRTKPVPRLLRTIQPDDELGGVLFLSLPCVVTHHIDVYSMLHPPVEEPINSLGLGLRQVDGATGGRDEFICPVCGESYGTHERWVRHVRYQKVIEANDEYPVENTHLSLKEEDLIPPLYPTPSLKELREHFKEEIAEIICVVEGIDPLMSGTFQALQSYQFEDIVWNEKASFAPCLHIAKKDFTVDLDRFHEIDLSSSASAMNPDISYRRHDSVCST